MKLISLLLLIYSSFYASYSFGKETQFKSIYGVDNRRLISEGNTTEYEISKSVAAQISLRDLIISDGTSFKFSFETVGETLNMCSSEKFATLPFVSDCSGFLVGKNLLMTAGHCMKDAEDCQKKVWAFDYVEQSSMYLNQNEISLKTHDIYRCSEVVAYESVNTSSGVVDYALVRLNRNVTDRDFLKVKRFKKQKTTSKLAVIGHPLGMPKMIIDQFIIRDNSKDNSFVINSDTFSGSSGSPVIDMQTHLVVGMLIRGETDLKYDLFAGCNRNKKCGEDRCLGETVTRSNSFPLKYIPIRF